MRQHIIALLILFCAISTTNIIAQWESTGGPFANNVYCTLPVIDETNTKVLFTGTSSGVFKLTYNGTTWSAENRGLSGSTVYSLAILGTKMYAGTSAGLYSSTDSGITWSLGTFSGTNIYSLMISANNIYAGYDYGMYFSNNNGMSWKIIYTSNPTITYSFADDGTYLYGGCVDGIYAFTNDSTNKSSIKIGLKNGYSVTAVAAAPYSAGRSNIFAGTTRGIFRSTDSGATWDSISTGLTYYELGIRSLAVKENGAGGFNVFAGTYQGVFKSTDQGNTWNPTNTGIFSKGLLSVYGLTVSGSNIYASTELGVFLSTNDGSNWYPLKLHLADTTYEVNKCAVMKDQSGVNHIYAGCRYRGLYHQSAQEKLWTTDSDFNLYGNYGPMSSVLSLCAKDTQLFIGTNFRLHVSTDGGPIWKTLGNFNEYISSIFCNDTLLIAGRTGAVSLSKDNGTQWQTLGPTFASSEVWAITLYEKDTYAGTKSDGVYLLKNADTIWKQINNGLQNKHIYSFASVLDNNEATLYAGTDYGVFKLNIGDTTWTPARSGFSGTGFYIRALAPYTINANTSYIFAGTYGGGVYLSKDMGTSWRQVTLGFSSNGMYVNDITIVGDTLLAGTKDGVWKRSITEILTDVKEQVPGKSGLDFVLQQNYPNPFNPATMIRYSIAEESKVSLKIFDILGNEVATLVNKTESAGNHSVSFAGNNLPSGIYFYTLRAGNYAETKKMLLLK